MELSRREWFKWGAAAAAAWGTGVGGAAGGEGKKLPIGLQLYSVRNDCAQDLPGVLAAVAKMGYQGVEFAGYHGRTAAQLRELLDKNHLKCCGTHTSLDSLLGDALSATVEFNKTLGNPYLIVPWIPHERLGSVEAARQTAALLTELAQKVKPHGMHVGYHAHGGDFQKVGDQTSWDLLFSNAGPDVLMQMDLGNCLEAGGDPYAALKKFPGRSATIHLKEAGGKPGAVIGEGIVRWKEVFEICESTGGTQWYIVEQEAYAGSPLEACARCLENLKKMGK
jgi:sugar phosphate isomerase/epimerase